MRADAQVGDEDGGRGAGRESRLPPSLNWIERYILFCFRKYTLALGLTGLLFAAGIIAWTQLPIEAYPDLGPSSVLITTQMPGLAAEEMEQQVTTPLERGLASVPGVMESRSVSTFGLSLITLIFADGSDIYRDRTLVLTQLASIDLTNGAKPVLGPISGPSGEIYRYTLESPDKNLMELSDIQNWVVMPALRWVPGIVAVDNFGGLTKQYQLKLDPQKMQKYGVGLQTVLDAVRSSNTNAGGGRIARGEQSWIVRGVGLIHSLADMGNIVVTEKNGAPVLLKDLGIVAFGHQVREGILGKDGNPDMLEGIVTMLRGANPEQVLASLHERIEELQKRLELLHVKIVPYLDRAVLVHATIDKVGETIGEGVLLVLLILTFFLGSPACAVVTAVTIPFALAVAFVLMRAFGMGANLFSLGAIDFGVIVDGAIVIAEIVLRLREEDARRRLEAGPVLQAILPVGKAIFSATLIIIVAYSPLFAFQGSEGKLFHPMAWTVSFALLGALICSLSLIPFLSFKVLQKPGHVFNAKPIVWLEEHYGKGLGWFLDRPAYALGAAGMALMAVIFLGSRTGQDFMPSLDEGALWLQVELPSGISLSGGEKMANRIRDVTRTFPETSYAITQLGRSDDGTDSWTPSHIEMPVGLKPYGEWPDRESKAEFIKRLRRKLKQIPGISFTIGQPIEDNLQDQLGGAHAPLVLRVFGPEFSELRRIGAEIVALLKKLPGTVEVSILQEPRIPNVTITAKRMEAARYGISVADISDVVGYVMGGQPLTTIIDGERFYDATLHVPHDKLADLNFVRALPVQSSEGAQIPLAEIADIALTMGESTISHHMGQRQLTIQIDNGERALSDYVAAAQKLLGDRLKFDHQNYRLEWAGALKQAKAAQLRLSGALVIMFVVMIGLLSFEFRRFRHALLVMGVVPLAALGGLIALNLRGESLNIATSVGFIALFGVAIQNGILMIGSIRKHLEQGKTIHEASHAGALERFRPVLTTATVASAGMTPAAIATGIGTDVQRGLATVVVGGLGLATLLTLFLLPICFCALEQQVLKRTMKKTSELPASGESL